MGEEGTEGGRQSYRQFWGSLLHSLVHILTHTPFQQTFINTFKLLVHKIDPSCLSYSTESQEAPRHTDILYAALSSKVCLLFTSLEDFEARTHDDAPFSSS